VYLETIGGGSGARWNKDGLDGVHVHMTNTSNLPVEALEVEYPLTLMRYELVDGSGGAGRYRGGMAIRRVYRADHDCHVRVDGARILSQPWGLDGGLAGGFASITSTAALSRGSAMLRRGDLIAVVTGGSGGYGPAAERDALAVERDVREARIDTVTAQSIYNFPA
jgi:N-methylhydantoinase B